MPFDKLNRPPLSAAALRRALVRPDSWVRDVVVTASTPSTNADVLAAAHAGAPEGTVHTTDLQTAGKGRLGRVWTAPPASSIAVSVLLRPSGVPMDRWTLLPLLAGLAVDATLRDIGVLPGLKWPNDVQIDERKIAGIMIEVAQAHDAVSGPAAVVGIGLNTTLERAELPVPTATSLLLAGARTTDRTVVLRRLLRNFEALYRQWKRQQTQTCSAANTAAEVIASYRSRCDTLGRQVRIEFPDGTFIDGTAEDIDTDGRIVIDGQAYASGDVVHLRPVS